MRSDTCLLLAALLAAPATRAQPRKSRDAIAVIVDAERGTLLRWALPDGELPGDGFRVERTVGGGRPEAIATVRPQVEAPSGPAGSEEATLVRDYLTLAAERGSTTDASTKERFERARFAIELSALTELELARAVGIAYVDRSAPAGAQVVYTVIALGWNGQAETRYASSAPTAIRPMPPPSVPEELRAVATRGGVQLFWQPSASDATAPGAGAASFEVLRGAARGGALELITPRPVLLGLAPDAKAPQPPSYLDDSAPKEQAVRYAVRGLDLFGRRGALTAPVEVFVPDFAASDPPFKLTVASEPGRIRVQWQAEDNRNRRGFLVRRALAADGPWDVLTAKPTAELVFADRTGRPGSTYYYAVAAVDPRGTAGPFSPPVKAEMRAAAPPAPPKELSAERKTGAILLRWEAGDAAVVRGFTVERDAGGKVWVILNADPTVENRFVDDLPVDILGTMRYRVSAIGLDGQTSQASAVLSVQLPRTRAPLAPEITRISGTAGRVELSWRRTGEREEAAGYLILRSTSNSDDGDVLTPKPLAADATRFVDDRVLAGSDYWYRVVTVDSAGNRSPVSKAAAVRVASPPLPVPPPPKLRFEAKPYPRVIAEFVPPKEVSVRWVLERRGEAGQWHPISGSIAPRATAAMDARAPRGRNAYRLSSVATNGVPGPASPPVEIDVP